MIRPVLAFLMVFMSLYSWAQPMGGYQIGAPIKNFTLLNVANKQPVSLEDYSDKKIVVLIFTSNNCPYSKIYEDRIITLNNRYSDKGVVFLLINPASNPTEKVSML